LQHKALRKRAITLLVCLACTVGGFSYALVRAQATGTLDGLLFDYTLEFRSRLATLLGRVPRKQQVAVIALDARSLDDKALASVPRAMMGPVWAQAVNAVADADPKAIVFDLLLAYSGNAIEPRYDTDFLRALGKHRERTVLGRSGKTLPARPYLAALRFDPNALGLLEITRDRDNVFRRVPTATGDPPLPTLAGATITRVTGENPGITEIILAPAQHPETLPTYSLIDLLRCAETDPRAVRQALRDRVVFFGSTLAEEDRKLTSARFMSRPAPETPLAPTCLGRVAPGTSGQGQSIPGVFAQAEVVNAWLQDRLVRIAPAYTTAIISGIFALFGALVGLRLRTWAIAFSLAACVFTALALETALLWREIWLPAGSAVLSLAGSVLFAYGVRYWIEERQRRWIQHAFSHYLSPAIVDRLAEHEDALELKGEYREVTIMFADLSGFTALSEKLDPKQLMRLTNHYLAYIIEAVHATGGYVDKFIGDAVMALWGAPVEDGDHAVHAVQCALQATRTIKAANQSAVRNGEDALDAKIGLYSGRAVVGNVGSRERLNYTAIGEVVNVASRIEGLAGVYQCPVVIGDSVATELGTEFVLRELDRVVVKGKQNAVTLFQPMAEQTMGDARQAAELSIYASALALYRQGNFSKAAELWESLLEGRGGEGPESVMAARARGLQHAPPGEAWDGVWVFHTK
jgi:adenylate cyclase